MKKYLIILVTLATLAACVEPFEFETETFENALVIEASLTNENKRHKVILSRAVRFEDSIASPERNAQVLVRDDAQNEFSFQESEAGTYVSNMSFAAAKGMKYTLEVVYSRWNYL